MKQMTLEEISKAAASGAFRKIPVSREIYSDIRTPVETLKVLQGVSSHCYMLESVEDKKQWGRYTFLGYDPSLELTCVNGNLTITADAAEMKKVEDIPESHEEQLPTGQIRLTATNIRDFSTNKHRKVDDYPYSGGGGMLMNAQPVYDAYMSVAEGLDYKPFTIYMSPQGKVFNHCLLYTSPSPRD